MAGRTLNLKDVIVEDQLGTRIAQKWIDWSTLRQNKVADWEEVRKYVYATDTSVTTNSKLPWKNKTTIPKLCQIRDNLFANYMATLFPKRKWLTWEPGAQEDNTKDKRDAIVNYMTWALDNDRFKTEMTKMIQDYIDYGNCFGTVEWEDQTIELEDRTQTGYVGPVIRRISPLDIVFNPIASSFDQSPKIIRSLVSMGDIKEMLTRFSKTDDQQTYEEAFKYLNEYRSNVMATSGSDLVVQDNYYAMDGFTSFRQYLESDYVELLSFYGDMYDYETDTFYRNYCITVVDRHKVLHKGPNPSFFGSPPIWHCGWRPRQDNLWAMGPLDNLVGMQYRIDHIENLKADIFDLTAFPPLKIKGYVEDFVWGPFEKIYVGDDGDVAPVAPNIGEILNANVEIKNLENTMEEMAGAPKEAMGFRSPGEKTMYEVQRLENAASRIFTNKTSQFEEQFVERLLNGMLELARRKITSASIRVFDDELKFNTFVTLTPQDITGVGRIRPIAARHFAERAELVQNINNFFNSHLGQDQAVTVHFSGQALAKMIEEVLDIADWKIVLPYIRLSEAADAQRLGNSHGEQVQKEAMTPSGIAQDDFDPDMVGNPGTPNGPAASGMDQAPPGPQGPPGV